MKKPISLLLSAALALCLCVSSAWAVQIPPALGDLCTQEEWDVLKRTNQERLARGLTPYSTFATLQHAADVREKEVAERYSHTRPSGEAWSTVLTGSGLGYTMAGENIAAGQTSPDRVVTAWMGSDDHRANLLDPNYTHMGVGYTASGFLDTSWVQLFLNKGCSVSEIALSRTTVICEVGTSLDDLDLYIEAVCPFHGTCYLPLLSGMCTGFDPETAGQQTVTVSYGGRTAQLLVEVGALDISSADSWAVNWLLEAEELDLLSALNRDNFTANITRLQFADLAVRLAERLTGSPITPAPADSFVDTTDEIVRKAKAADIAAGYQNEGTGLYVFRPNNPIQRQEICVMLSNMIRYVDAQRGSTASLDRSETMTVSFPDQDLVASWAIKQVALITNNGIMSGRATETGTKLTPMDYTTLQEAVTLTVKLHNLIK